jgi:hypothetical protein
MKVIPVDDSMIIAVVEEVSDILTLEVLSPDHPEPISSEGLIPVSQNLPIPQPDEVVLV